MGLFLPISMAAMTMFPGTSLIIIKINWGEQDLPLRIGAFEPPLSSAIIHGLILY